MAPTTPAPKQLGKGNAIVGYLLRKAVAAGCNRVFALTSVAETKEMIAHCCLLRLHVHLFGCARKAPPPFCCTSAALFRCLSHRLSLRFMTSHWFVVYVAIIDCNQW